MIGEKGEIHNFFQKNLGLVSFRCALKIESRMSTVGISHVRFSTKSIFEVIGFKFTNMLHYKLGIAGRIVNAFN